MSTESPTRDSGLSFQHGHFRKDVGKFLDPATGRLKYRRFSLGRDQKKAARLAKLIQDEWRLIKAHGGDRWTAEALHRIELARHSRHGMLPPLPPIAAPSAVPSAPPASAALPASKMLYTVIDEFIAGFEASARSNQISKGRWVTATYALNRLKLAMPDCQLALVGLSEIRGLVNYFSGRPISASSGRRLAPATVIDTLIFIRNFFSNAADAGEWVPPMPINKLFRFSRKNLYTEAEREEMSEVKVFDIPALRNLWQCCGSELRMLIFLLGLNCGFCQTEIATLRKSHCHLKCEKPFIRRLRHKTSVLSKWRLWPETAQLLAKFIARSPDADLVVTNSNGLPVVYFSGPHRNDTVHHQWGKIRRDAMERFERDQKKHSGIPQRLWERGYTPLGRVPKLGFKHLRKTGSTMIRRIAGRETADIYLAHADAEMRKPYTNKNFSRLSKALRKMREHLEPVFNPYVKPGRPVSPAAEPAVA